jgi:hypothetical protein
MRNNLCTNGSIIGIITLLIGMSITPTIMGGKNPLSSQNTPILYDSLDQENSEWGYSGSNDGAGGMAQSFKPTLKVLTRVELRIWNEEPPTGYLTVSIRDNLYESDLTSITISLENLPQNYQNWTEFDFVDIEVIPEQTYYIVCSYEPQNYPYITWWGMTPPPDHYPRGEPWDLNSNHIWTTDAHTPGCDYNFRTYGYTNQPPNPPCIDGSHYGKLNTFYDFSLGEITDPDGDPFYCLWDWGDGNISGWGPYNSGVTVNASHSWSEPRTYTIKVKLYDVNGLESNWSTPFNIVIVQLNTAVFLGSFENMSETEDLWIIQSPFFIAFPSDVIFYADRTIVISKDSLLLPLGSKFNVGLGGIAIL